MERLTISKLEKQTIYEIYRACRICGAGGGYRMPIIQNIVALDTSDVELVQKIQECLQLEVRSDDRMPPLICELCVDKVNDYYEFLKQSRQTNIRTRTRLGLPLQTVKKSEEPPVPSPAESRASSVSSRSSRTARRAPTPPRPIMLGNKKVAEKEQEKGTESNDFIKAEPSPPRYKPGPKSRQAPREDPKSRTAPKEDPKSRLAPREDPKSRTAPKEDPKSRLALRDPKSLQGAKEDPKSRQAPKEDPKIPVPLKILKSKSKLNVVSTPPKPSVQPLRQVVRDHGRGGDAPPLPPRRHVPVPLPPLLRRL
ncbi:hypothetical protein MSG28_015930 [Choristoneura fumiferana]|uniref:Uncharacterized protein n=1 Tax=Choristoneura fumiferana TaxID=7141 RepID=A0ACC0K4T1_CHOFU|nr:hypothetical protein MSG28_015930 [Choristoneura fumiferana]